MSKEEKKCDVGAAVFQYYSAWLKITKIDSSDFVFRSKKGERGGLNDDEESKTKTKLSKDYYVFLRILQRPPLPLF
jgi:hypothetical protein